MKTLMILGDDKISSSVKVIPELKHPDIIFAIDKSTNIKRILRLIFRRRINLTLLIKMVWCELGRENILGNRPEHSIFEIKNNENLLSLIDEFNPSRVILFRAGLIINSEVITRGVPLMNIHCAKLPVYGGLGSIYRALNDGAIHQAASLHRVTTRIDEGEIIDEEPYTLDLGKCYCENENTAYSAGINLLRRCLADSSSP